MPLIPYTGWRPFAENVAARGGYDPQVVDAVRLLKPLDQVNTLLSQAIYAPNAREASAIVAEARKAALVLFLAADAARAMLAHVEAALAPPPPPEPPASPEPAEKPKTAKSK